MVAGPSNGHMIYLFENGMHVRVWVFFVRTLLRRAACIMIEKIASESLYITS